MRVGFRRSFLRDLKKIKDKNLKRRLRDVIHLVEEADSLGDLQNLRRLRGSDHYYRIRIGDYRVGLLLEDDTVVFVRFLHRKDIYRYFP